MVSRTEGTSGKGGGPLGFPAVRKALFGSTILATDDDMEVLRKPQP
jgi:hypothetical protein